MDIPSIKLHKTIYKDDTYVPTYTVSVEVTEAIGVTPNIFVERWVPASKYTGEASFIFNNVAYFDELTNVPDFVANSKLSSFVRRSCATYSAPNEDKLNEWITIVTADIRRLLESIKTNGTDMQCYDVDITADNVIETAVPCCSSSSSESSEADDGIESSSSVNSEDEIETISIEA